MSDLELLDAICEQEITDIPDEDALLSALHEEVEIEYRYARNAYLSQIYEAITGKRSRVIGEASIGFACRCCGAKTIDKLGEYDICECCSWEDDGIDWNEDVQVSLNNGSLRDYRKRLTEEIGDRLVIERWEFDEAI